MNKKSGPRYVPALGFQWLTPFYDLVVRAAARERTFKSALIDQANLAGGLEVLDLACGTGTLAIWIKKRFPDSTVTGVDGDTSILAIASRKARKVGVSVKFDHALSFSLPYADASFDRIVSSLFFHHLVWKDKQRTANELYRVMKPGGELHTADWGQPSGPVMRVLFLPIQIVDGFTNTQDNASGKLIRLFEEAGFMQVSQVQQFSTVFGTMALYRATKPATPALR